MAIFGFGKDKESPADPEQVLAYLEDALRVRSPFTVGDGQGRETSALLHSVNEEARSFRLLPKDDLPVAKGAKVAFTLIHEGLRLGGAGQALEVRPGILALRLPDTLGIQERRKTPRARLNPKELATLTALQDLFEGVGITGTVENLSEGGAKVVVDKAVAIGSEKRLVLGPRLVPAGQKFLVVKLNKVPRCPAAMEVEGKAAHLGFEGGALVLGIAFSNVPAPVATALRAFVQQRCPPAPTALPPKVRRPPEPRGQEPAPDAPADPPAPPPAGDPAERRHSPRLSLGDGFQARFMAGDALFPEADLLDLSTGGCCLRLPLDRCQEILQGVRLDEFHFLHPDLPTGVLEGRVKWVLGRNPGALESGGPGRYCLVGVEFQDVPDPVRQAIAAYVARHMP
jgi:c-di-GMP-binding flagellar brake protein YcgR